MSELQEIGDKMFRRFMQLTREGRLREANVAFEAYLAVIDARIGG